MKKLIENDGVTLVVLVITIILLLILAGIAISQLIGSELFEKAILAKEKSNETQRLENQYMKEYENEIIKWTKKPIQYNDIKIWLSIVGITKDIDSLDELNNEEIEKLMNSKESIEYMINSKQNLLELIVSSSNMIANLGKYKEVRAEVLKDEVWREEIMNSEYVDTFFDNCEYNSQDGTVEATLNSNSAINAFNGGDWGLFPYNSLSAGQYIQYNFSSENTIYRLQFKSSVGASSSQLGADYLDFVIKLKGSKDGENFEDITENLEIRPRTSEYAIVESIFDINTDKKYLNYQLEIVSGGYEGKYLSVERKCNFGMIDIRLYTY